MSTDYGFRPDPRIAAIKPKAELETGDRVERALAHAADRAGDKLGFESRESLKPISRRKSVGPTTALNVRCPVRVFNPFARFCENEGLTYWEAIERLMELAGVDENGKLKP